MVSPRSTSPPKSAWPGVSTMLIFVPPSRTAVFLARIVMPFSRSRSIESRTRSATSWLARTAPACQSMASTKVVLPWSTWATIATLRTSSRATSMTHEATGATLRRIPGGRAGDSVTVQPAGGNRMKRAVTLLGLFLAGVIVAPAQATPPADVKQVGQSREEVLAYWTAERMRNAKPAPLARGGKAAKGSQYPFTRYEPASYNPAHGKVFFTDGGVNYVCSGTALTSGNESVVWTAGHCVNEGPGPYFTNWAFVPAYKDGARPYGTWTARTLLTTADWGQRGDFGYDLGAAVVNTSGGATLTDTVGSRGAGFNQSASQHYLAHGYPAAPPFTGGRMY